MSSDPTRSSATDHAVVRRRTWRGRDQHDDQSSRADRPCGAVRSSGHRGGPAHDRRHDLPDLLDDEAGRVDRPDAAPRGGSLPARTSGRHLPARVRSGQGARRGRHAGRPGPADRDPRRSDAHQRTHLRLHDRHSRGADVPRDEHLQRRHTHARGDDRRTRDASARLAARCSLALQRRHRRGRTPDRGDLRPAVG